RRHVGQIVEAREVGAARNYGHQRFRQTKCAPVELLLTRSEENEAPGADEERTKGQLLRTSNLSVKKRRMPPAVKREDVRKACAEGGRHREWPHERVVAVAVDDVDLRVSYLPEDGRGDEVVPTLRPGRNAEHLHPVDPLVPAEAACGVDGEDLDGVSS